MKYDVRFGSAFAIDQFGFVRKGQVTVDNDKVLFSGNKSWSALAKVGIFFLITVLPYALLGFGFSFLLAFVVIHYFCASAGSLTIQKTSINDVVRKGRKIQFKGQHPESGKTKKTVFKVDTGENAVCLENELKGK